MFLRALLFWVIEIRMEVVIVIFLVSTPYLYENDQNYVTPLPGPPLFPLPRSLVLFYLLFKGISHSYCETSSNIRSRLYRHSVLLRLFLFLLFSSHELLPEYASALRSWERHKTPLEYSSKTYIRTARESSLGVWSIKYVCASHFSLKYANCEQHKPATFPAYGNFRRAHIDIQKSFQLQKHSKIGLCQYGVRAIRWHY